MIKESIISVIIPTYNRANLLPRAIQSVLNQTYQNFELIIVDDKSTDDTKSVVDKFNDKRIKYIQLERTSGNSAIPKNTGIKIAQGKYIAFLDDDDEWLPDKLKKQVKLFEESDDNKLGFVGCNGLIIEVQNNKKHKYILPRSSNFFYELLIKNFILSSSSVMVKKNIFTEIGLFNKNLVALDWDMWLRMAQKYNFDFVQDFLLKHYIHDSNITKILSLGKFNQLDGSLKYILNKYKKDYKVNSKIYSARLRNDGTKYILGGKIRVGRKYFIKSIKINPLNFKSYIYFIFSLFGSKFYYGLTLLKKKLRQI